MYMYVGSFLKVITGCAMRGVILGLRKKVVGNFRDPVVDTGMRLARWLLLVMKF